MRTSKSRRREHRGPLPSTFPTSAPTPERAAHAGRVEPPRMNGVARRWWSVRTRLDALLEARQISRDEYDAACRLRADAERIARGSGSPLARLGTGRTLGAQAADGPGNAQLDATRRIERVRAQLGERDFGIICAVAVEDVNWTTLAARIGTSDKTAKLHAAQAIRLLTSAARWDAVTGPRSRIRSL